MDSTPMSLNRKSPLCLPCIVLGFSKPQKIYEGSICGTLGNVLQHSEARSR